MTGNVLLTIINALFFSQCCCPNSFLTMVASTACIKLGPPSLTSYLTPITSNFVRFRRGCDKKCEHLFVPGSFSYSAVQHATLHVKSWRGGRDSVELGWLLKGCFPYCFLWHADLSLQSVVGSTAFGILLTELIVFWQAGSVVNSLSDPNSIESTSNFLFINRYASQPSFARETRFWPGNSS